MSITRELDGETFGGWACSIHIGESSREKIAARASELAADAIYSLFDADDDFPSEEVGLKVYDAVVSALEDAPAALSSPSLRVGVRADNAENELKKAVHALNSLGSHLWLLDDPQHIGLFKQKMLELVASISTPSGEVG